MSTSVPRWLQRLAGGTSVLALGGVVAVQFAGDLATILHTPFTERLRTLHLTSLELLVAWVLLGLLLHRWMTKR